MIPAQRPAKLAAGDGDAVDEGPMRMAAPTLDGRLLCASEVAYSATQTGPVNPANSAPYYVGSGFIEPPTAIVDGPESIDACIIGRTVDGVVIAFRGTPPIDDRTKPLKQRIRDWCNDFRAELVSSPGLPGRLHAGFLGAVTALWPDASKEIQRQLGLTKGSTTVYMTGHSKGGAMANIACLKWAQETQNRPFVTTFAAPRAGSDDFAAAVNTTIPNFNRFEYGNDIVPHLPPHIALIPLLMAATDSRFDDLEDYNYQSAGQLFYVDEAGTIESPKAGRLADHVLRLKRFGSLAETIFKGDFDQIVSDHSIDCGSGYQRAVCPTGVC
jgi:hypothetical protein